MRKAAFTLPLAAAFLAASCSSPVSHPRLAHTSPPPATAPAPAATAKAAATAVPVLSRCDRRFLRWKNARWHLFQAVNSDVTTLMGDAQAHNLAAVEGDGTVLIRDAGAASSFPMPGCADTGGWYTAGMSEWVSAGTDLQAGNINAAGPLIGQAGKAFRRVTAEVRQFAALTG